GQHEHFDVHNLADVWLVLASQKPLHEQQPRRTASGRKRFMTVLQNGDCSIVVPIVNDMFHDDRIALRNRFKEITAYCFTAIAQTELLDSLLCTAYYVRQIKDYALH